MTCISCFDSKPVDSKKQTFFPLETKQTLEDFSNTLNFLKFLEAL